MSPAALNGQTEIVDLTPELLEQWIGENSAVLIDVREDFEHAAERIGAARSVPLSRLDPRALRTAYGTQRIVFHCRTGKRSTEAAKRYRDGSEPVFQLAGGLENWKASGRDTKRSATAPRLDVMRQVQIISGTLVLAGVLLGAFASPWFLVLSGFVGGGLILAGASGWCGMARLMAQMPWNRRHAK